MPAPAMRVALRQSRLAIRRAGVRNASSTTEATSSAAATVKDTASSAASKAKDAASSAAAKTKDTVSQVTSKASEGLSRVTSSAGETVSSAASATSSAAGKATGRIGRLVSTVQSLVPPTVYYSRVGLELGKLIFKGQGMAPPSVSHLQTYYQPILSGLRNPTNAFAHSHGIFHPVEWLNRIRNMNTKDFATVGVVAAEVLGFFTIGEMIGKMKIVGYAGETAHH